MDTDAHSFTPFLPTPYDLRDAGTDANVHADADWSPSQAPCRHTPDHHANAYPHTETRHDADQPDNRVGVRPPLFRVGALPQPLH